jgi:flagellar FliL protein
MRGHKEASGIEAPPKIQGGKKLMLLAVPVAALAIVAGLWFSGMFGAGRKSGRAANEPGTELGAAGPATYLDVPEILTNLNVPGRHQTYLKLHAKLELGGPADTAPVTAAMPRILDLFQTYLRDTRPEELRGSEGTYRLREELLTRAAVAVAPAHVTDVLFVEMIVQ